ncbi:S-methyl-5'-thioadenosine phosphorylase [Chrysiogenes arsenatis]|uniref:S-methyl-5'-thioadenosine phosphorylase n=1 Tax=Chrysiogenes arsenatis TaxID=309797 RepID=UPI00041D1B53|nr:S-methyl-5'-thioadenosine phosphorylase [Chrysiogenes arsenatis]
MRRIGIIGGSGLYQMEGLTNRHEIEIETPYGSPSDSVLVGTLGDCELCFLPRHGRTHTIAPNEINFRANIYALKTLGVETIVSVSAVGSLRQHIAPGDFVIVNQFIDFTRSGRPSTFFEKGIVGHVSMADPVCPSLRKNLIEAATQTGVNVHTTGTYICMEGPQFSSRAESHVYRQWGADVVGMTNMPEAKLAREAEICYATVALSTDYDCWKEEEEAVSVEMILDTMHRNVVNAKKMLEIFAHMAPNQTACHCQEAARYAIITPRDAISEEIQAKLEPLYGKYFAI